MTTTALSPKTVWKGHNSPVRLIEFGPQGLVLTADTDVLAVLWKGGVPLWSVDLRSPNPRHRPLDRIRAAAFSPDGEAVYLASGRRLVALATGDGQEVWSYRSVEFLPFMLSSPFDVKAQGTGNVVVPFDNGMLELIDPQGRRVFRRKDHDAPVWVNVRVGGASCIGCDGYHIHEWSLTDGRRIQSIRSLERIYDFSYSDASGFAVVRGEGRVLVGPVGGLGTTAVHTVQPGPPVVRTSPSGNLYAFVDGHEAVAGSVDRGEVWRTETLDGRLVTLSFGRTDNEVWTGHEDGTVACWAVG